MVPIPFWLNGLATVARRQLTPAQLLLKIHGTTGTKPELVALSSGGFQLSEQVGAGRKFFPADQEEVQ